MSTTATATVTSPQKNAYESSIASAYGSLALVSSSNFNPNNGEAGSAVDDDPSYPFNHLKPSHPEVSWPKLELQSVVERGLSAPSIGKPKKENLILRKASKWRWITPALGVELHGIDLKTLTGEEKDDLALLGGQVGVIIVRDNDISVEDQLAFGRHFGPLHKHATTGIPRQAGLEEIHLVYADAKSRPDTTAFAKEELYHSDVTYELQPPGLTSLTLVTVPEVGGDTIFSSGAALYSSFSPGFQLYLESLSALHSGVNQANGTRAAGRHVRREPVETIHPVVRVHPATGVKSVFVNPGFTRRIVGVPKTESDAILALLYRGFTSSPDFQVRANWQKGTTVLWDNRVVNHSALFDFFPEQRHGVRVTPTAEKPVSVAEYEASTGLKAKDWAVERARELGVKVDGPKDNGKTTERGFKD